MSERIPKEMIPKVELTRRQFLKASAATAAVAAIGERLFDEGLKPALTAAGITAQGGKEQKFGWCRMCHRPYCPTKYTLEDGIVTQVEGDPRGPWSNGRLCVRGNAAIMSLYNPYRMKTPMKRTNPEKGLDVDPEWVEISWEEAYSTVTEKFSAILKDDPRKLVIMTGFGADYTLLHRNLPGLLGVINNMSITGAMCSHHWGGQQMHGSTVGHADPLYGEYIISMGRSLGPNVGHAEPSTKDIVDAIQRGAKVVTIDPRCSPEASKGEWVPVRPGTEFAFLLAMTNSLLNELGVFDEWFVKNRTNGPYLIGPDGNYARDAESNKPLIWDPGDNKAKAFDDASISDYALDGTFHVNGKEARPAFVLLKEHVAQYSPEWAEEISTIPAATTRRLAKEFVEHARIGSTIEIDGFTFPFRPSAIIVARGLTNHYDGHMADWMAMVLNALIGAVDVPGGAQSQDIGTQLEPDADGVVIGHPGHGATAFPMPVSFPPQKLDISELYPYGFSQGFRMVSSILEPEKYHIDYAPEGFLTFGVSLFSKGGDPEQISEALRRIPFIASIAYSMDEHTAFADIVLPECSTLERYFLRPITERKCWGNASLYFGDMVTAPIVEPMYDTKQGDTIIIELADRLGVRYGERGLNAAASRNLKDEFKLDLNTPYSIDQIIDRTLQSKYGPDKGLAYFKDISFIARERKPAEVYNYFQFPGNKTRHPIYNQLLKLTGEDLLAKLEEYGIEHPSFSKDAIRFYYQPIPSWRPTLITEDGSDFDLNAVVWKNSAFLFDISNVNSNPYLQEASATDPFFGKLLVNPATAARKGLKDGDMVYVESQFGGKIGPHPIKVTETVHPDVLGVVSGLARTVVGMNPITANGIPFNRLLTNREESLDVITGAIENGPRVRIVTE